MGSTQSIPIQRTDRSNCSLSTPPNYCDIYSESMVSRTSCDVANQSGGDYKHSQLLPRLEYGKKRHHLDEQNESDYLRQRHLRDSSDSKCIDENSSMDSQTPQRKKFRLFRKPAARSNLLHELLNDVGNYKMKVELSYDPMKKRCIENRKAHKSQRIDDFNTKQKNKSLLLSSNVAVCEVPHLEKTKRSMKPSAKRLAGEEESKSNEYNSRIKRSKINNHVSKEKMKQTRKASVLNHVLFMSEQSTLAKDKGKESFTLMNSRDKIVEPFAIAPDLEGPPRTVDQNSDHIMFPHVHDVLLGRGNGVAQFPGNQVFRDFCWNAREAYHKAMRNEKGRVAENIIALVRKRKPSGRFLEQQRGDLYTEVHYDRVKEKICQALREKKWIPYAKSQKDDGFKFDANSTKEPSLPDPQLSSFSSVSPDTTNKANQEEQVFARKGEETSASTRQVVNTKKSSDASRHLARVCPNQKQLSDDIFLDSDRERVAVYWPLDDRYYNASIMKRFENLCYLKYDDDEYEWLDLSKHKFKVISSSKSVSPRKLKSNMSSHFSQV